MLKNYQKKGQQKIKKSSISPHFLGWNGGFILKMLILQVVGSSIEVDIWKLNSMRSHGKHELQ